MRDYWVCPFCNAALDHGEKCDCNNNKEDLVYEDVSEKYAHRELQRVQG